MLLIQAGGLGYMTISSLIMVAIGRRISVHERMTLADALNATTMEGLLRFTWTVALLTFAIEGIGALIMGARFAQDVGWAKGLWYGLFHAVSAFNNAGFALFSDNLMGYRGDLTINLVITTLIIAGGLGFFVLSGLLRLRKKTAVAMSVHTKLVLVVTACLLAGGTLAILALEWTNPKTLGPLGYGEKLLAAYFQAVTPRTAGFNTVDYAHVSGATLLLTILLMFIGGSPGSCAGGVKTTSAAILFAMARSAVLGRERPDLFRRTIPWAATRQAQALVLLALVFLVVNTWVLQMIEGGTVAYGDAKYAAVELAFEAFSAMGTVGLSTGITPELAAPSKLVLILLMYVGRLGPLTMVHLLTRRKVVAFHYASENLTLG
jgi:trk system potassium uptake protein TrkH